MVIKKYMRIGKQPLQSAKMKHLQKKSTSYCSYTNISLERHLKLLKVLYILCLPTKQPKKDLKEEEGEPKGVEDEPKDVKKFTDLLDIAVTNLKKPNEQKSLAMELCTTTCSGK